MIGRLDLADLLVEQHLVVALAVENLLARLAHADRAQRVGLARPAERRLHLLPRLLQRLVGPLRDEAVVPGLMLFSASNTDPGALGGVSQPLLDVLDGLVHDPSLLACPRTTPPFSTERARSGANGTASEPTGASKPTQHQARYSRCTSAVRHDDR